MRRTFCLPLPSPWSSASLCGSWRRGARRESDVGVDGHVHQRRGLQGPTSGRPLFRHARLRATRAGRVNVATTWTDGSGGSELLLPRQCVQPSGRVALEQLCGDHHRLYDPIPPTGSALSANRLTWVDNSPNETGFVVERKVEACAGSMAFTQMTTMPKDSTGYLDNAVVEGGRTVTAWPRKNPAGQSPWSNTAERTVPWTIPVAPGTLKVVAGE